ncbi:MAG: phospholipase [Myxococcales bacterium]|nr:phospholipase [Myxococcales bacterium]
MTPAGARPDGTFVGLRNVATGDLEQLLAALRGGVLRGPLTRVAVCQAGYEALWEALRPYTALDTPALTLLLETLLAERSSHAQPRLELVWSGTDAGPSLTRYTRVVVPELFALASQHVTLAGYSFDHGEHLFEPLHRAMIDRKVLVRLFVDIQQLHQRLEQRLRRAGRQSRLTTLTSARHEGPMPYADAVCSLFRELDWPFGAPFPEIYFDPRSADTRTFASLHAKCVVVDHELSLVTSANFTDRGQARNIEVGVLIRDRTFALALEQQWFNLIHSGGVVRWGVG